ncbi:hypothetical protein GCM10027443_34120 [Pontibacter brevis]
MAWQQDLPALPLASLPHPLQQPAFEARLAFAQPVLAWVRLQLLFLQPFPVEHLVYPVLLKRLPGHWPLAVQEQLSGQQTAVFLRQQL